MHPPILFGTNFDVGQRNSLSLWERARVRETNEEYPSFSPHPDPFDPSTGSGLRTGFSLREKEPIDVSA
jgi:hypothetical protein